MLKFDDQSTWPTTIAGMCEVISEDMEFIHPETKAVVKRTAREIYEGNPYGELWQVIGWFMACAKNREQSARVSAGEDPHAVFGDITQRAASQMRSA